MAKRKKSKGLDLFKLISLALVALSLVLWFVLVPLKYESGGVINVTSTISYVQGTFGYTEKILGVEVELLKFSVINFVPLVLMVLTAVVLLLGILSPKTIKANNAKILVIGLSLVSLVLLVLFKVFLVGANSSSDFENYKLTFSGFIIPILLLGTSALQVVEK